MNEIHRSKKKFSYSWRGMIIGTQIAYMNTEYRILREPASL